LNVTHVSVDPHLCIACGLCADICPEVFELGDEYAVIKENAAFDAECCQEAADACPTEAITLDT
jgi:ferredoxin